MKLTFFGTSHGVPSADRYCCCTLLESEGSLYLLDAGAPVIDCLLRSGYDIHKLRAAFVSHVHGDHTAGLFHVIELMNWYYKQSAADFYLPEQPLIDAYRTMLRAIAFGENDDARIHLKRIDPTVPYEDENIKVEYIPTKHMGEGHSTYALLVTEGDKRVLFSGDLSGRLRENDVPAILAEEELDLYVTEMAHYNLETLTPYLQACKAKRVAFTHVFPLKKYDDIEAAKPDYPFEILCPNDGDILEL
ncbi:MAG: ribonuclease Z [Ruminococcaceae bacterium]|nr:ribonuclease Z [Oscillospiraceae bacterium]